MLVFVSFFEILYLLIFFLILHHIHVLYKGDKSDVQTQSLLVNTWQKVSTRWLESGQVGGFPHLIFQWVILIIIEILTSSGSWLNVASSETILQYCSRRRPISLIFWHYYWIPFFLLTLLIFSLTSFASFNTPCVITFICFSMHFLMLLIPQVYKLIPHSIKKEYS